jgi:hypothetical protein
MNYMPASRQVLANVFCVLLICSLLASPVLARDALHPVNRTGSTELSFKDMRGDSVRVTVIQSKLEGSYLYHGALLWGGDIDVFPESVVSALQIQTEKKTILIPLSAYGDLGDVMSVSFGSRPNGFRVSLHGGNTASSYDATLFFERGILSAREVRLRELPDERFEITKYAFPAR